MEHGWKPLPLSLKILFVLLTISVVSSFFSLISFQDYLSTPIFVLGIEIVGWLTIAYWLLSIIAHVFLLHAMWMRKHWAWKFGLAVYLFFALTTLLSFLNLQRIFEYTVEVYSSQYAISTSIPGVMEMTRVIVIATLAIQAAIAIAIALVFYWKRGYFEEAKQSKKTIFGMKKH